MRSDFVSIIISIIGLLLAAWPIIQNETRYFDYPFAEFDTAQAALYSKRVAALWKLNWFAYCAIIFIEYLVYDKLGSVPVQGHHDDRTAIIYIIAVAPIIIKDSFHNVFAYKKKTERLFLSWFDNLESLNILILLEVVALAGVWISFINTIIYKRLALFIVIIVLELFFCIFRMLTEISELIHLHKVNRLSIKMNDGTIYEKITSYEDQRNSIRIMTNTNEILFLSKSAISTITKEIDKSRLVDIVRKTAEKNRLKKAERKKHGNLERKR